MTARRLPRLLGVAVMTVWAALLTGFLPSAAAQPCPDVEVIFARGTGEPPGVGGVGQSFVDALRSQVGGKTVDVYPVNYAASGDFNDTMAFAQTVIDGIRDAGGHVQSTAANCPNTRIVLGGYSQGAAVAGFVTSAEIPPGVPATLVPQPLPPEIANHVAAVALFGKPSEAWTSQYGAPAIVIGPAYAAKTIQLCAQGDTICDGTPGGGPTAAHALYPVNGMVGQAATFVAGRL
ncbi:cutinase family protein [Mycobacterium sp. 1274761.0]|uniref:cutinase family protein n=1 Tax=Mycobacterium sp. 1274761.0 TaxID=1834077 RepID=UPI0007FF9F53|nr:cutinase family protein [Mycobacterium sp. 1274761.0]OBK78828.1 cutinase [Mycobacterium sp. 1274761.0]